MMITGHAEMKNTTTDPNNYFKLWEELGQKFPYRDVVHSERGPSTLYWMVMGEIRPFAEKGYKLLDIGCNDGLYTISYCQNGSQALGIDISPTVVQKARNHANTLGGKCRFASHDIQAPNITEEIGEQFDVVLFSEVLAVLQKPDQALTNLRRLLRPGGYLVLTAQTPLNLTSSSSTVRFHRLIDYVRTTLAQRELTQSYTWNTSQLSTLCEQGTSSYFVRNDGYYPIALKEYIERVGFHCVRYYTIGRPTPLAIAGRLMTLINLEAILSLARFRARRHGKDHMFAHYLRLLAEGYHRTERKIPLINLVGLTNVGVFYKIPW